MQELQKMQEFGFICSAAHFFNQSVKASNSKNIYK